MAFDEPPPEPNPGYGPFIIVTSDHSQAISDWEGSGDAVIGIHGPLGEDSEIGTTGARISHGCIRLHDQALEGWPRSRPGPRSTLSARRSRVGDRSQILSMASPTRPAVFMAVSDR